jgi:hypothetical protein
MAHASKRGCDRVPCLGLLKRRVQTRRAPVADPPPASPVCRVDRHRRCGSQVPPRRRVAASELRQLALAQFTTISLPLSGSMSVARNSISSSDRCSAPADAGGSTSQAALRRGGVGSGSPISQPAIRGQLHGSCESRLHDCQQELTAVARTGRRPIRPGAESHRVMRRITACSARPGRASHAST